MTVAAQVIDQELPPPAGRREGYMPYLDGLRGVAILLVLLLHGSVPLFRVGGWVGVDIFFVLSGFLITSLLVREQEKTGRVSLRHFYMRRVLRLLPAVVVFLIVFLLIAAVFMGDFRGKLRDSLYVLFYVANWIRAFSPPDLTAEISHCWSLSIEEQFYFVWPLLFIVMAKLRLSLRTMAWTALAGAIACAAWRAWLQYQGVRPARIYFGFDTRFDALLLGCALAMAPAVIRGRTLQKVVAIAAGAFLVFVALRCKHSTPWLNYIGSFLIPLAVVALIIELTQNTSAGFARAMTWRPLVWLGRISYGVYLWHLPIFEWIHRGLAHFDLLSIRAPVKVVIGGGVTLAIAVLSYKLVEMPFLKLKSRFQ